MSDCRAAARREKKMVAKLARRKGALGEIGRMQAETMRVGRVLGFCIFATKALDLKMLTPKQIGEALVVANQNSTIVGCSNGSNPVELVHDMWRKRLDEVIESPKLKDDLYWGFIEHFMKQAMTCMIQACNYLFGWTWYQTGRGKANKILQACALEYMKFRYENKEANGTNIDKRYTYKLIDAGVPIEK